MTALVFAGHMIDRPTRLEPRFPSGKEELARAAITKAIRGQLHRHGELRPVISGGANGGDIIFQEVCHDLGLKSEVYLPLSPEEFRETSVSFAGPDWDDRYDKLLARFAPHVLDAASDENVWARCNEWILNHSLAASSGLSLIALWNGETGDGTGGTAHMVAEAAALGGEIVVLNTRTIFGLD